MTKVRAEMMREFVRSQKFTSTDEVMTAIKNMFKYILQEVMECELAHELGYEKSERTSNDECIATRRKITEPATQKRR